MKGKTYIILAISVLFLLSLGIAVYAAMDNSAFGTIFSSLSGENFSMVDLYSDYGTFIDMIVYTVLFIGIAQVVFGKRFKDQSGKTNAGQAVVIALGLALAIALSVWGNKNGFNLLTLGPLAGIIFIMLFAAFLYYLITNLFGEPNNDKKGKAILSAIVLSWYLMKAVVPESIRWLENIPTLGNLMRGFIAICLVALIITLIVNLSRLLTSSFRNPDGANIPPGTQPPPTPPVGRLGLWIISPQQPPHNIFPSGAQIQIVARVQNFTARTAWTITIINNATGTMQVPQINGRGEHINPRHIQQLPDGEYTIIFDAIDPVNTPAQEQRVIRIGGAGPGVFRIVIAHPTNGQHFNIGDPVLFEAAIQNGADPIQWEIGSSISGRIDGNIGRNIALSKNTLPPGNHVIRFIARDPTGNTVHEDVNIIIGAGPGGLTITVTSPAPRAKFPSGSDILVDASVNATNGRTNWKVTLKNIRTGASSPPWGIPDIDHLSTPLTGIVDGNYSLTFEAENTGTIATPVTVDFTVGTTHPPGTFKINVNLPNNSPPNYNVGDNIIFDADIIHGANPVVGAVYINGIMIGRTRPSSPRKINGIKNNLPAGTYQVKFIARDSAGTTADASRTITIGSATPPPPTPPGTNTVINNITVNNSTVNNINNSFNYNNYINYNGDININVNLTNNLSWNVYVDDNFNTIINTGVGPINFNINNFITLKEGKHKIIFVVFDKALNLIHVYVLIIVIKGGKQTVKKKTPTRGRVPKEKVKEVITLYHTGGIYGNDQRNIPPEQRVKMFKEDWTRNPKGKIWLPPSYR